MYNHLSPALASLCPLTIPSMSLRYIPFPPSLPIPPQQTSPCTSIIRPLARALGVISHTQMHLPPSLDPSILTSPLYHRSSSHRNLTTPIPTTGHDISTTSTANSSNDIPSPMPTGAIMLKSSPSPVFRGRSPPKYLNRHPVSKRRWRAIGRVVVCLLIVFVVSWMGKEGVRCRDSNNEGYVFTSLFCNLVLLNDDNDNDDDVWSRKGGLYRC